MPSEAYSKGMRAKSYSDNPYHENSHEFDEFERGFTQKLKRQPESSFENGLDCGVGFYNYSGSSSGSRVIENTIRPKENAYAAAKKK